MGTWRSCCCCSSQLPKFACSVACRHQSSCCLPACVYVHVHVCVHALGMCAYVVQVCMCNSLPARGTPLECCMCMHAYLHTCVHTVRAYMHLYSAYVSVFVYGCRCDYVHVWVPLLLILMYATCRVGSGLGQLQDSNMWTAAGFQPLLSLP